MSNNTRERLSLEEDINIEDLVLSPTPPPTYDQFNKMKQAGELFGFTDRSPKPKKLKKTSPYIVQHNTKLRLGMKELLNDLMIEIGARSTQETLELSILAMIEKSGNKELLKKFNQLIDS